MAVQLGFEKLFTFVRADNPAALETYRRHGFQTVGTARHQAEGGRPLRGRKSSSTARRGRRRRSHENTPAGASRRAGCGRAVRARRRRSQTREALAAEVARRNVPLPDAGVARSGGVRVVCRREAVFFGNSAARQPAVVAGWAMYFDAQAPFSAEPDTVRCNKFRDMALTSGPLATRAARNRHVQLGLAATRRHWQVVADRSCPPCAVGNYWTILSTCNVSQEPRNCSLISDVFVFLWQIAALQMAGAGLPISSACRRLEDERRGGQVDAEQLPDDSSYR